MAEDFESVKKITDLYFEQVLKPLLPNIQSAGYSSVGGDGYFDNATLYLSVKSNIFNDSIYQFKDELTFIHYTSIDKLLSILNEGKIRLYDLNNMTDPTELHYGFNELNQTINFERIKILKSHLFSFSFCRYQETKTSEDFDLWRLYGSDGNGVGIVFTIEKENLNNWFHFLLSDIQYGPEKLDIFKDFTKRDRDFKKKHNELIQLFQTDELLIQLAALHKNDIYKTEKEVRLVYKDLRINSYEVDFKRVQDIYESMNSYGDAVNYICLDIFSKKLTENIKKSYESKNDKLIEEANFLNINTPKIKIKKIVTGYRIKDKKLINLQNTINSISEKRFDEIISSEQSNLTHFF